MYVVYNNSNNNRTIKLEGSWKDNLGQIGTTHDDITAEAVAKAFNRKLRINNIAKKLLTEHYKNSNVDLNQNRMKMALIPSGSKLILNPVSAAPGFNIENVWVMAGVPKIMQAMFSAYVIPNLKKGEAFISLEVIVHQAEGEIAHLMQTVQDSFKSLDIGSYPFYKPPNIGTSIILRGTKEALLKEAYDNLIDILKSNKVPFDIKK